MRSLLVVCVLMALVALTPAPGVPGSANAETISIIASDNAWVWSFQADADKDQDEAETLRAKSCGTDQGSQFTYLRFNVGPLADLATITSASLDMYWLPPISANNTVNVCALKDLANGGLGNTETSWTSNMTYNTRLTGTANLPNSKTSGKLASLPFLTTDAPHLASFDLTDALPGLLDSDTNNQLTLILYGSNDRSSTFASLANTSGYAVPTLNVGYEPIPEPGTIALLGMALLGVGWYVWRRRVPKIAAAVIIAFGLTAAVNAETISIVASDNAWVLRNGPDQSEEETLWVKSDATAGDSKFTYLRFDVAPLADATITSASLDMYWLAGSTGNIHVVAVNDLANPGGAATTETSWLGDLTWTKRPDGTAKLPGARTSSLLAGVVVIEAEPPKLVHFDLTFALPGLLDSDTNNQLTLILYRNDTKDSSFASLANTKGYAVPTLNVGYSNPIHEPGTLTLLGVALLGLGWYAWRKRRRGVTG